MGHDDDHDVALPGCLVPPCIKCVYSIVSGYPSVPPCSKLSCFVDLHKIARAKGQCGPGRWIYCTLGTHK